MQSALYRVSGERNKGGKSRLWKLGLRSWKTLKLLVPLLLEDNMTVIFVGSVRDMLKGMALRERN